MFTRFKTWFYSFLDCMTLEGTETPIEHWQEYESLYDEENKTL
jgi:hypothetical protein